MPVDSAPRQLGPGRAGVRPPKCARPPEYVRRVRPQSTSAEYVRRVRPQSTSAEYVRRVPYICLLVYFLPHVSLCGFIRYLIKYKFATNNGSGVSQKSIYFYYRNSPVNVSKRWGKLKGGSTYPC